jgi:hypothetical protein
MEQLIKDNLLSFHPFTPPVTGSDAQPSTDEVFVTENGEEFTDFEYLMREEAKSATPLTANNTVNTGTSDGKILELPAEQNSASTEPEILSFEDFCLALGTSGPESDSGSDPRSASPWRVEEDEMISLLVNNISDKLSLDPLMIPCAVLDYQRQVQGLLPHRSSPQIQARYSALCVLNKVRAYQYFGVCYGAYLSLFSILCAV